MSLRSSTNHLHGRLAKIRHIGPLLLGAGGFDTICTAVCDRCDSSTACRLCLALVHAIDHLFIYFTIVFNILLLQYVHLVSNVSLSCIFYMLLPLDVGIIYLLDVNKCIHLVSGGIHSTFLEILLWSDTEQVTGN